MRFHYFWCVGSFHIVNGQENIVVGLLSVPDYFVGLSHKEIAFILRKGDVSDLVYIVWDRNKIYCVYNCTPDGNLVSCKKGSS